MKSVRTAAATAVDMATSLRDRYLISTEKALYHSLRWLTTKLSDITHTNPHFKAPTTPDPVLNEGIAIYCIHGTADNVVAFEDVAQYLLGSLPSAISSINLVAFDERGKGISIKDFAEQLLKKIIANGHKTIILAGHSRGGLVAAYLYEYLTKNAGINVIFSFSVGTPYGGSPLALPPITWVSKSVQEMQKGSELLRDLHTKKDKSHHYVCTAAEADYIVRTEDATFNDTPPRVFSSQGHLSIMHDPRLLRYFLQTIYEHVYRIIPSSQQGVLEAIPIEDGEYYEVKSESAPELWDIYFEISLYLEDLKRSSHIQSSAEKISLFERLQNIVSEMMHDKRIGNFAETKVFGDFLHAFLADASKPDKMPDKIIDRQLNFPFSTLFGNAKTNSRLFIERLENTYKSLVLPIQKKSTEEESEVKNNNPTVSM
jgi:pimeloyl-ACP methyl ester carboxylesterase